MATERNTETVYCVKYALTQGIIQVSGSAELDSEGFMRTDNGMTQYLSRNEWSRNGEEALELATAMKHKKIRSIQKQRDKLLQLGFELPPKFNVQGTKSGRSPG